METSDRQALERFGALLMERVRDVAIEEWDKTVDGKMKDPQSKRLYERLACYDEPQRQILHRIIAEIVDTTLHYLL